MKALVFVLTMLLTTAFIFSQQLDASDAARIDDLFRRTVLAQSPSATVAISIDGNLVFAKGYGLIDQNTSPSPETLYKIGSVSKQFTAAGILALAEDGAVVPYDGSRFSLDSNLSEFFSGVDAWTTPTLPMNVKRLLSMTSNLPDYIHDPYFGQRQTQIDGRTILKRIKGYTPFGRPLEFEYSNTNYFLLANVIEILSKESYRDFLKRRIFSRAGLTSTMFLEDLDEISPLAPPSFKVPERVDQPDWPKGAGEVVSNVLDLVKWDFRLFSGKVVSDASVREMSTPISRMSEGHPDKFYAMGLMVRRFPMATEYSHDGSIAGYTAFNQVVSLSTGRLISVAILTNSDGVQGLDNAAEEITRLVIKNDIDPPSTER